MRRETRRMGRYVFNPSSSKSTLKFFLPPRLLRKSRPPRLSPLKPPRLSPFERFPSRLPPKSRPPLVVALESTAPRLSSSSSLRRPPPPIRERPPLWNSARFFLEVFQTVSMELERTDIVLLFSVSSLTRFLNSRSFLKRCFWSHLALLALSLHDTAFRTEVLHLAVEHHILQEFAPKLPLNTGILIDGFRPISKHSLAVAQYPSLVAGKSLLEALTYHLVGVQEGVEMRSPYGGFITMMLFSAGWVKSLKACEI